MISFPLQITSIGASKSYLYLLTYALNVTFSKKQLNPKHKSNAIDLSCDSIGILQKGSQKMGTKYHSIYEELSLKICNNVSFPKYRL